MRARAHSNTNSTIQQHSYAHAATRTADAKFTLLSLVIRRSTVLMISPRRCFWQRMAPAPSPLFSKACCCWTRACGRLRSCHASQLPCSFRHRSCRASCPVASRRAQTVRCGVSDELVTCGFAVDVIGAVESYANRLVCTSNEERGRRLTLVCLVCTSSGECIWFGPRAFLVRVVGAADDSVLYSLQASAGGLQL